MSSVFKLKCEYCIRKDACESYTLTLNVIDPEHQRANGNLRYFEYMKAEEEKKANETQDSQGSKVGSTSETKKGRPKDYLPERQKYEKLCRGEGIKLVSELFDSGGFLNSVDL